MVVWVLMCFVVILWWTVGCVCCGGLGGSDVKGSEGGAASNMPLRRENVECLFLTYGGGGELSVQ